MQVPVEVHGQPSFMLTSAQVRVAITRLGGMLGPVTFFANERASIEPYSIAPWAREDVAHGTLPLLRALRGDFMCSAFGDNVEPYDGRRVPPHGDTANGEWTWVHERSTASGHAVRLAVRMPTQDGRCIGTTVVLNEHSFVYQRHDFEGRSGAINPGHHAMLKCPTFPGSARLSFGPHILARPSPARSTLPPTHLRSRLMPTEDGTFDLRAMPATTGTADVTAFPPGEAVDDTLIVCADPKYRLAWSAATFQSEGYVWLSLRTQAQLPSTLVWLSNGGMLRAPWNGRHRGVLGLEDVMAYFASGLAPSASSNSLNAHGIQTCAWMRPGVPLRIPYIQGVVRIPPGFDHLKSLEADGPTRLVLRAASGVEVRATCAWEFLESGRIAGLCED